MANAGKRPKAKFPLAELRRLGDFIFRVNGIVADIGANATMFATPSPALATITGHVGDLNSAQTLVQQRVPGSVATRNIAYRVVLNDMRALMSYVQGLADAAAGEPEAIEIINTSGFSLLVDGIFAKPPLYTKATVNPNTIKLIAKAAGKRASYNWQQSINNGVTWIDLNTTLVAKTTVAGLTSKASYAFRVRSITKEGISGWSNAVGIVIQ